MSNDTYIPGVCNIGQTEIRQRKLFGWIGLGATVALGAAYLALDLPRLWSLALFPTASTAAIGYLQARWHFCARFGLNGVFNFSPEAGKTDTVEQAEFRKQDRKKALQIIGLSVLFGTAVTVLFFFL